MEDITDIKIFFDERVLVLTDKDTRIYSTCQIKWNDDQKMLEKYLSDFSESTDERLYISYPDVKRLMKAVVSCFHTVEAAGGVVALADGRILMIKRLGKWDLPKGKAEKGETSEQTAVREVTEECGLPVAPVISSKLTDTYHTYFRRHKHVLKHTAWYAMTFPYAAPLHPQLAEDITDALWLSVDEANRTLDNTYGSVKEVLKIRQKISLL
ncbi:MAG: NUDIX domain-containing protein [Bacteroidales bacterium]|nr:NUDIX domain-containing protein [Bacteroidales bacterium]